MRLESWNLNEVYLKTKKQKIQEVIVPDFLLLGFWSMSDLLAFRQ